MKKREMWVVTWEEDDGEYQSGPYTDRNNALNQYTHRHTDPLARDITMWRMVEVLCP